MAELVDGDHRDEHEDERTGVDQELDHRAAIAPTVVARTKVRAQASAASRPSRLDAPSSWNAASAPLTSGTIWSKRHCPAVNAVTASSFAALNTHGASPPRSPVLRASATAGNRASSTGRNSSGEASRRSRCGPTPGVTIGGG